MKEELGIIDYLQDLSQRLLHVPTMYGVDQGDIQRLVEIADRIKIMQQTLGEFNHAYQVGPDWYTKGESALRRHVYHWLQKGFEALK